MCAHERAPICTRTHQAHTLLMLSVNFGQNYDLDFFFFYRSSAPVCIGETLWVPLCTYEHPNGVLIPAPVGVRLRYVSFS